MRHLGNIILHFNVSVDIDEKGLPVEHNITRKQLYRSEKSILYIIFSADRYTYGKGMLFAYSIGCYLKQAYLNQLSVNIMLWYSLSI